MATRSIGRTPASVPAGVGCYLRIQPLADRVSDHLPYSIREQNMTIELIEDRKIANAWRVEEIGSDGECYVAIFSGPQAELRAHAYCTTLKALRSSDD